MSLYEFDRKRVLDACQKTICERKLLKEYLLEWREKILKVKIDGLMSLPWYSKPSSINVARGKILGGWGTYTYFNYRIESFKEAYGESIIERAEKILKAAEACDKDTVILDTNDAGNISDWEKESI